MKFNVSDFKKEVFGAAAIIMSFSAALYAAVPAIEAAEFSKVEYVDTQHSFAQNTQYETNKNSNDNFEVNYKAVMEEGSPLPDKGIISMEEAAKIGVKDLIRIFNFDAKGKTVNMWYCPVGETCVSAEWMGNIDIDKNITYYFTVDAVTGKISATCRDITLNKNVNKGFYESLPNNCEEYKELAKKTIKQYNILPNDIKSIEYEGQGYVNDNPDIQIKAMDIDGNETQLSFSRDDKRLLQVCYDNWVKDAYILEEKMLNDDFSSDTEAEIAEYDILFDEEKGEFYVKEK